MSAIWAAASFRAAAGEPVTVQALGSSTILSGLFV